MILENDFYKNFTRFKVFLENVLVGLVLINFLGKVGLKMTKGRKNRKRKNCIIAVTVLLALLLAACGSGNGDDTKDADTQKTAEPEKKTEDTPAEQTLDNESSDAGAEAESKGTPISDLSLNVDGVMEDSFMAKEVLTDDQGNAGEIAVLNPEEAAQIKVIFTDQTTFTVRTSADMGATYTDAQGTSADLEVGGSVEVSGTRDGDTVYASTVMIMKFS